MFVCISEKKRRWAAIELCFKLTATLLIWNQGNKPSYSKRHVNQTAFRSNSLAKALNTAEKLSKKEVFIQLYWINFNKEIKKQHLWVGGKAGDV